MELNDSERAHAAALAPYLAKRAALLPEVRGFREGKGGVLAPGDVVEFLRDELGWRAHSKEYPGLAWDLEQVSSELPDVEELKDLVGGRVNRSRASRSNYEYRLFVEALEADSMALEEPAGAYYYGVMHLIRSKDGRTLGDLSRRLLSLYPWPLRDAAWFVLTGDPPEVEPVRVYHRRERGEIALVFAPWILEETIRRAYRSVQLGDNRPLEKKSLALFRFVTEHTKPGEKPRWSELTRSWNGQYPEHRFIDRFALRRAYKRAEERLAAAWVTPEEGARPRATGDLAF